MSQSDSVLIKLARKWINRLLPLVRFTSFISSTVLYDASFSYLLDAGCEPIGFDYRGIYIYMKCKGRLIRVIPPSQYQGMFREVLSKMPKLDATTINRLTNRLPHVVVSPSGHRGFLIVYGDEPIYLTPIHLTKLGELTPYLDEIEVHFMLDFIFFKIDIGGFTSRGGSGSVMGVDYIANKDGSMRRSRVICDIGEGEEERTACKSILADLEKKHFIIDRLLEEAYELFAEEVKQLITVFLY